MYLKNFIGVQLIYNVVLVSGVQQSEISALDVSDLSREVLIWENKRHLRSNN